MIRIVVAVDQDFGFAKDGVIPWNIPEDFKHFMNSTTHTVCIMGKNTYLEARMLKKAKLGSNYLPSQALLSNRHSLVISKSLHDSKSSGEYEDVVITGLSISELLCVHGDDPTDVSVLGGGGIFKDSLPYVDEVVMTHIPDRFGCNSLFPIDSMFNAGFKLTNTTALDTVKYGIIAICTYRK